MTNDITVNGKLLSEYGVTMLNGGLVQLMTPASMKEMVINDDPRKDGVEIVPLSPKVNQREITLEFVVEGNDRQDFFAKRMAFLSMLAKGELIFHIPTLGDFRRLWYQSATSYEHYRMTACKLAIKFLEPNPNSVQEPI